MLGGRLLTSAIILIQEQDLLISAFSHQLYFFSVQQATVREKIALHDHPIIALYYESGKKIVYSVDEQGWVCSFTVDKHYKVDLIRKFAFKKNHLKQAKFAVNNLTEVFFIGLNQNGNLSKYSSEFEFLISKQVIKIHYFSSDYIIVGKSQTSISILKTQTSELLFTYTHEMPISSVEVYQKTLIVGDVNGKINLLVGFLENGEVKLRQKLQWHVHEVSSLKVDGSYLYSAGEEGVVVLWHLRQNKRDFLPRIGSKIQNLAIIQSKIYCFLSDNTLKSIDLSNDKSILHYKIIVDPRMDQISDNSSQLITSSLLRTSSQGDKIYLRSLPGRIQQLNLFNGINTQYNILNRNLISRLDKHFPSPHQITDICLSSDNVNLAVSIQGVNCRSIKFYEIDLQNLKLVSKIQNCHNGLQNIQLISLGDKFISYCLDDKNIKVWKLITRRKESILQVDEYFWCCQYEITHRGQAPKSISHNNNKLFISYGQEFIIFNLAHKTIENIYSTSQQKIVAVYEINHHSQRKFIIFYAKWVQLVVSFNNSIIEKQRILTVTQDAQITANNIVFNSKQLSFALLMQQMQSSGIYIYQLNQKISHFQVPKINNCSITDIFWLGDRLIAFDSNLYFYDVSHQKELLQITSKNEQISNERQQTIDEQEQTITSLDYNSLYRKYLERQYKKDKSVVDKNTEILAITPSISAAFQLFTNQLFI